MKRNYAITDRADREANCGARRVVVTGLGLICGNGNTVRDVWNSLVAGKSGVDKITRFDTSSFSCKIASEVKDFDPLNFLDKRDLNRIGRFAHLAMAATEDAIRMSGLRVNLNNATRIGVAIGSAMGGCELFEDVHRCLLRGGPAMVSPSFICGAMPNVAAALVSIRSGAKGPNKTKSTGCASSAHAIAEAYHIIQRRDADVMITGGAEAPVTALSVGGFAAMRALSVRNDRPQEASRPWDNARDGFVMGEGSGILILEDLECALRRDAHILAEVIGCAMLADAHHITQPAPMGEGACAVMTNAIDQAGIGRSDVDYINAHGTSTLLGDVLEAKAIRRTFGKSGHIAVSSTKSMTGHLLGGAGALEAGITILALRDQILPPTINLSTRDAEVDLDLVPNVARKARINVALSNSFAYGGTNVCLVFRRWTTP